MLKINGILVILVKNNNYQVDFHIYREFIDVQIRAPIKNMFLVFLYKDLYVLFIKMIF
jgi:hypothetical protein